MMNQCGLIDLGAHGPKWTWNNKRVGMANIKERLDRFLANTQWCSRFPNAQVIHLPYYDSNHRVLLIDLEPKRIFKPRPYRLEDVWTEDSRFTEVVKKAWNFNPVNGIQQNYFHSVDQFQKDPKIWNKKVFGNLNANIEKSLQELNEAQSKFDSNPTDSNKAYMNNCLSVYLNFLRMEEIFWKQKSRVSWLLEGYLNTKFFHSSTLVTRSRNMLVRLKDNNGRWL